MDLKQWGAHPVANVGDAMDRLNLMDSRVTTQSISGRCVGPALTVPTPEGDSLAIHRAPMMPSFGDLLAEVCLAASVGG